MRVKGQRQADDISLRKFFSMNLVGCLLLESVE